MNIVELFPNTLSECAKPRGNVSTCTSKHISIPVLICHKLDIQRTPDRNLPKTAVHDISRINYPTNKLVKVNRSLWRKHSFFSPLTLLECVFAVYRSLDMRTKSSMKTRAIRQKSSRRLEALKQSRRRRLLIIWYYELRWMRGKQSKQSVNEALAYKRQRISSYLLPLLNETPPGFE